MATFSPSPAPRKRYAGRGGSPANRRRIPSSRLATPAHGIRDDESMVSVASVASGMDVDEGASVISVSSVASAGRPKKETVFAKSEELFVQFYANLPVEVKQILRNADFLRDAYTGDIDTVTGFALVASAQNCFAWQHAQALAGTPTCYIFSCPLDYTQNSAPLHVFVPYGSNREPGLILLSVSGDIRFWDSVGIGLAGGDHFSTYSLGLDSGEIATTLSRSDLQTYVASTSNGRIFRLTLTSSGGKHHLTSNVFSRPQASLLSRFLWSSSGSATEAGNINAIAFGEPTALGRDVWAAIDTRIQKWNLSSEGWEELQVDEELAPAIRAALKEELGSAAAVEDSAMDLELLDLALERSGQIVVLTSYAGIEEDYGVDVGSLPRRIYALVRLSYRAGDFRVEDVGAIPYQSTSSSGAPMHPRLKMPASGALVAVQFGDAVALCARDSDYRDRLALKTSSDRTLGVALGANDGELLVLTAAVTMKATVDMERVKDFDPDTGKAQLIKSTMTQGIMYGQNPENPLHFSFPPEVDEESLMAGAEQLSRAVLESDSEVVRPSHDLHAQLSHRMDLFLYLNKFINNNGALTKLSPKCRQRLLVDAEKLYAATFLWVKHNELLLSGQRRSVLNDAVYAYMHEVNEGHHEDIMRAFFRLRVIDIGKIIPKVMDIVRKASFDMNRGVLDVIPEANLIVLTILNMAWSYRALNTPVYGVDLPMFKPWTSRPTIIDVLCGLFEDTTRIVESPAASAETSDIRAEPHAQLPMLAAALFACCDERIQWLESPEAAQESGSKRERELLVDRFQQLRPEILETLRRTGQAEAAFALAEKYHDFRNLAALCHKEIVYPPHQNPYVGRIQEYVERFREPFATELFQWYIEHGEIRAMFAQEETYGAYIARFFADHPHPTISWIHDLGTGDFGAASECLFNEAENAPDLVSKQLMLSIGKLAHLAQLHAPPDGGSVNEAVLEQYHDQLDLVSVHEMLLRDLKSVTAVLKGKQSLEAQIDMIVAQRATRLAEKKALFNIFKQLVRHLLQGRALHIEDVVDALTLRDNNDSLENYATALHLLSRDQSLPGARRLVAFRSTWRRIYIHDDWNYIRQTVGVPDAEINERLQGTALFSVLVATLGKRHQPPGYILEPAEALPVPTGAELASRWPGMAPDQVEEVLSDYTLESDILGDLELEDVWDRVRELAEAAL